MHTVPSGLLQQLLCCPSLAPGKRLGAGMLMRLFCVTVCSLAMPLGEEYLAVQEPWDHEQLQQGKRKMQGLCTSKVSSTVIKDRGRGAMCNFPPPRSNQEGLSLSPANPLQLFLVYFSLGILDLCAFNTLGCVLWRDPLGDTSFYSPSEALQEVHTDLIFLSTISLLTELNIISFPERCQFSPLDQVPVLAQLINSPLLWKDKGLPYTNTHTHTHAHSFVRPAQRPLRLIYLRLSLLLVLPGRVVLLTSLWMGSRSSGNGSSWKTISSLVCRDAFG